MYKISEYSNKIKHLPSGEVFSQDDRDERYLTYLVHLKQGVEPEIVSFLEGEELEKKQKRALEIDFEYTKKIDDLMSKHVQKKYFDSNYVMPQIAIDEYNTLRNECNLKIAEETGITDYSYRQSIPKLATINL